MYGKRKAMSEALRMLLYPRYLPEAPRHSVEAVPNDILRVSWRDTALCDSS